MAYIINPYNKQVYLNKLLLGYSYRSGIWAIPRRFYMDQVHSNKTGCRLVLCNKVFMNRYMLCT